MSKKRSVKEPTKSNVILFPASRIVNPERTALRSKEIPKTLGEVTTANQIIQVHRVNQIMELVVPLVAQGLLTYGINITQARSEAELKNCAFMLETIRSYLYKQMDLQHPIQTLAENLFSLNDGSVSLNKINVKEAPPQANNTTANN
jgi:hypothetical protein